VSAVAGPQAEPAITSCGRGRAIVVWSDGRGRRDTDLFGARVDSDGTLQDPFGVPLADGPGDQTEPAVACNGEGVLLAWADTPSDGAADVRAERLDASLRLLEGPFVVTAGPDPEYAPAVAFGPPGIALVAYESLVDAWDRRRVFARIVQANAGR
jgi:hypothetical protein